MNFKDKTVCVWDNGLFVSIAQMLARSFGKVLYYTPWVSAFPTSNQVLIGDGVPGIERIKYPWKHLDEVDLHVFPDVYFSDVQLELERQGKRVWGARNGDQIELYRFEAKALFKKLGLPVGEFWAIDGLNDLRDFLQDHPNVWVKVSCVRGDMESWHSINYTLSEPRLDELEHKLGAKKHVAEFIVEAAIDDAVEVGYDGFTIDGRFADTSTFGYELKDASYIGRVCQYDELPEPVRLVNSKLADWLAGQRYRGFLSTELRITKEGTPYLIDPCARAGSPPSEVYQELYSNWPDIMWEGSEGRVVEPEPVAKFAVEVLIHSYNSWADRNWQPVGYPDSIAQFVKLRNMTVIDGKPYCIPQNCGLPEIGAVVGLGDTVQEAIEHCQKNAGQVEGYYLDTKVQSLQEALNEVKRGEEEFGIQFAVEIPEHVELSGGD